MIKERKSLLFGEIAVRKGFVTKNDLRNTLRIQSHDDGMNKDHRVIGRILQDVGLITDEQVYQVLGSLHRGSGGSETVQNQVDENHQG